VVKDTITYDGWGQITNDTNMSLRGRYGYTGREEDVETGWQYNRARYYDSVNARWISQDPLGFDAGDSNLYRYALNAPTLNPDPSGNCLPLLVGGVLVAGPLAYQYFWGDAGGKLNRGADRPLGPAAPPVPPPMSESGPVFYTVDKTIFYEFMKTNRPEALLLAELAYYKTGKLQIRVANYPISRIGEAHMQSLRKGAGAWYDLRDSLDVFPSIDRFVTRYDDNWTATPPYPLAGQRVTTGYITWTGSVKRDRQGAIALGFPHGAEELLIEWEIKNVKLVGGLVDKADASISIYQQATPQDRWRGNNLGNLIPRNPRPDSVMPSVWW
jgi:RHS repeat-associated protein